MYSCVTRRAPCGSEAENKKQTRWLNSLWLIQMVSTPASCENVGETKRRGRVWHCSNYLGDCDSATSEKTKSRSRLWASAGICVKHSALQHVLEGKGATSFDLTFGVWTKLKWNCQSVESEFSSVMQNSPFFCSNNVMYQAAWGNSGWQLRITKTVLLNVCFSESQIITDVPHFTVFSKAVKTRLW